MLHDASPKAKDLVTYMMSDGYLDWLAISPEGKVADPDGEARIRRSTPTAGASSKRESTRRRCCDIYSAATLKAIAESPNSFQRWGLPQNQGELAWGPSPVSSWSRRRWPG